MSLISTSESAIKQRSGQLPGLAWLALAVSFWLLFTAYFSPVLVQHGLLGPGDGEIYYLPFLKLSVFQLWNDNLLSGYPIAADIQAMTFYPLRWLTPSFNCLVISAYVVAALGTFGLCLSLTGSRLGALAGALVVSGSGFMLGHLGHLSIIHAAAWVPFVLWAVVELQRPRSWRAVALGAIAVAMSVLGGHPQISIIGLLFSGMLAAALICYAFVAHGYRSAVHLLVRVVAMFSLGLALASPSLVGLIDAAASNPRSTWGLADFSSYSLDFASIRLLWFPNFYGSMAGTSYGPYSGPPNLTELALYVGLIPWMLGCLAICQVRRDMRPLFWAALAAFALLLALGATTPIGELVYRLPVLGKFRAQARFGWIFVICMGVLSSFGISTILSRLDTRSQRWMAGAMVVAGGLFVVLLAINAPPPALIEAGIRLRNSPAIMVPIVAAIVGLASLILFALRRSHATAIFLMVVMLVDLATFGWFHDWRLSASAGSTDPVPAVLRGTEGRVLVIGGENLPPGPLRPNVNLRYDIPLVTGYGPLLPANYASVTGATTVGAFPPLLPDAPLLDVLGVKWIAGDYASPGPILTGHGCGTESGIRALGAEIPASDEVDAIRITSHLSCSQDLTDGHAIADVVVADGSRQEVARAEIDVGTDTSEWAYDRPDVKSSVRHARAHVADSFDAGGVRGLWFDKAVELTTPARGGSVEVSLRENAGAPFKVRSIEARDRASGAWRALQFGPLLGANAPLSQNLAGGNGTAIRQRTNYRGQVWMACEARQASLTEISNLLRVQVPGGIDPFQTVLLEAGTTVPSLSCKGENAATILGKRPGYWEIETSGASDAILVVSSSFNAGWRVTVDGKQAQVLAAYGAVLGVPVPAGDHRVVLHYMPRWFSIAVGAAGIATIVILLLLWSGIGITMKFLKRGKGP
ncbi:MAG TPA: YfhO family protein [Stenotrophomonas sp.]|nr:YfhO family protein [Stenotrophomonas sp.]